MLSFFLNRIRLRGFLIFFFVKLFKGKTFLLTVSLGENFFLKVMKSVLSYFSIVFIPGPDLYRKCGSGSGRPLTVVPAPDPGCHCSLTVSVPVSHSPCPSGVFCSRLDINYDCVVKKKFFFGILKLY